MKCRSGVSPTGLPQDIVVAEILPRLHIKTLFTFKCVSKLFNSIISDPNFERSYMQRAYSSPESSASSGLLSTFLFPFTDLSSYQGLYSKNVKKLADAIDSGTELHHADAADKLSINVCTISLPYKDRHKIIGSSNGLVLSRFYSGDEEMLKYREIEDQVVPGVDMLLSLWRLVDSSGEGEWCLEGRFRIPTAFPYGCKQIMVAPYRWSRDVICHPFVMGNNVTVFNPRTGTRKYVNVFVEGTKAHEFKVENGNPLIPVEMCPWSCPFYAQSS